MIVETIKKHPVMTVGAVGLGCLVLFVLVSSGGGGGGSMSDGPSADAALSAATSLQAAQIKAGSDLATAQLAYKGNLDQLTAEQNIAQLSTNAALLKSYNDNDTALKVQGVTAGVQNHQIDAMTSMQLAQYSHETDMYAIGAGVDLAQISANRDASLAQTGAMVDIQRYAGDVQKSIAQYGAQTQQALSRDAANMNASNQKGQTARSAVGGIGGLIGSILSIF